MQCVFHCSSANIGNVLCTVRECIDALSLERVVWLGQIFEQFCYHYAEPFVALSWLRFVITCVDAFFKWKKSTSRDICRVFAWSLLYIVISNCNLFFICRLFSSALYVYCAIVVTVVNKHAVLWAFEFAHNLQYLSSNTQHVAGFSSRQSTVSCFVDVVVFLTPRISSCFELSDVVETF